MVGVGDVEDDWGDALVRADSFGVGVGAHTRVDMPAAVCQLQRGGVTEPASGARDENRWTAMDGRRARARHEFDLLLSFNSLSMVMFRAMPPAARAPSQRWLDLGEQQRAAVARAAVELVSEGN